MTSVNNPYNHDLITSAQHHKDSFRTAVLALLLAIARGMNPFNSSNAVARLNGSYNGSKQQVLAPAGAGFKYIVRSLYVQTEDASADFKFVSSPSAVSGTNVDITPNLDTLGNSGAVLNFNPDGWMETAEGHGLFVTSNNPVDLLGTAVKIPV